jgi:STE24 endopeptidase
MTTGPSRATALGTGLALSVVLAVAIAVTTPWRPLAVARRVRPDPTRDFSAQQIATATRFTHAANLVSVLAIGVTLAVTLVIGLTPLGARLIAGATGWLPTAWPLRVTAASVVLVAVGTVVAAPFGAWRETIYHRFGLSVQTWGGWAVDQLRAFAVGAVTAAIGLLVLVGIARALPRLWWAAGAVAAALLVAGVSFVYPLVVEPLFNSFTPMAPGPLRTDLVAMARADGVAVSEVLVADASRRTTALNAYVSGFGATRRIVVYDTLLKRPDDEVRLVVAHELGHAARGDVLHGTLIGAVGAAAAVCMLGAALTTPGLLRRAGADGPTDVRVLALVVAVVALATTVTGPVQSLISRRIEARADVHSLDVTGDAAAFTRAMKQLGVVNLANPRPNPVLYALYADHPSVPERIAMARAWAAARGMAAPPDLAAP